ncbi:MAG: hypothetical protein GY953_18200 [bacterium]|nr:hypothetical protein [bacterium]
MNQASDSSRFDGTCGTPDIAGTYPELIAAGWKFRCSGDRKRIDEQCEIYKELGFEIRTEPIKVDKIPTACRGCFAGEADRNLALFTRRAS